MEYEPDADMIFNYLMVSALAAATDFVEKEGLKPTGGNLKFCFLLLVKNALTTLQPVRLNERELQLFVCLTQFSETVRVEISAATSFTSSTPVITESIILRLDDRHESLMKGDWCLALRLRSCQC